MLALDRIYVDWIVKNEKFTGIWDVFLMLWTLRGLGRDNVYWSAFKNHKTSLTAYKWATVPTCNTFLDVQHSKDEAICSRPDLPGDSFLVESSGW